MVPLPREVHYAGMKHKESKGPTRRRDPSNPAGSTGQTKPARMYADDEQEQAAALARQGVEAAQRELARDARRTEPGKATGKQ
jgi:hypothetical protein